MIAVQFSCNKTEI